MAAALTRRALVVLLPVVVLLVATIHSVSAQAGFNTSSTLSPTLTALQVNVSRGDGSPAPTESPLVTGTGTGTGTGTPAPASPVLPPTTSYFSVTARFKLLFQLDASDSQVGLMNDTQVTQFQTHMESLTQQFANQTEWQKVVTMCNLIQQQLLTDGTSTGTSTSTMPPSINHTLSLPIISNNDTALFAFSDANANLTTTATTPSLQDQDQDQHNYEYLFQMTYLSSAVNVSQFPQRLLAYSLQNTDLLTLDLQTILDLTPQNNLQISTLEEIIQLTLAPTIPTPNPTLAPTLSMTPSYSPSVSTRPSISPQPSHQPSIPPSQYPSTSPSSFPTGFPTFAINSSVVDNFALAFTLQAPEGAGYLNTTQEDQFCEIMVNQTYQFAPQEAPRVRTNCIFFSDSYVVRTVEVALPTPPPSTAPSIVPSQEETPPQRTRWLLYHYKQFSSLVQSRTPTRKRYLQETYLATIYTYTYQFRMRYTSNSENVTDFTDRFQRHIALNAEEFNVMLTDLLGLTPNNNLTLQSISLLETNSAAPTYSSAPSDSPTNSPTRQVTPYPTWHPTFRPSEAPPPTIAPSIRPTVVPSAMPSQPPQGNNQTTIIIVVVVVATVATITMAGMAWFYRSRRQSKLQQEAHRRNSGEHTSGGRRNSRKLAAGGQRPLNGNGMDGSAYSLSERRMMPPVGSTVATSPNSYITGGGDNLGMHYPNTTGPGGAAAHRLIMSPSTSESILSNPSLLSNGQDEDEEEDDEHDDDDDDAYLQRHSKLATIDDFDRFKDQNLEKMRASVEQSVRGIDGMMSQALTMAILGGVSSESLAGNDDIEMEANALCDVSDWVKRHEVSSLDERQSFMQEMLNKMVMSVRQGLMGPDDASRTIHECAALLSLQLLHDLPRTTVILSGMRKTVRANDVIRTFRKFGPIEDAAVASNQRGFGLVRFRNPKTVDQVMMRYRTSEIVVQDVAVQCKRLEPDR